MPVFSCFMLSIMVANIDGNWEEEITIMEAANIFGSQSHTNIGLRRSSASNVALAQKVNFFDTHILHEADSEFLVFRFLQRSQYNNSLIKISFWAKYSHIFNVFQECVNTWFTQKLLVVTNIALDSPLHTCMANPKNLVSSTF